MRAIIVFLSFLLASQAIAQELPETVTTPYLAYEAAMEAGEAQAAAEAAEQAWRAGLAANIDADTLMVLADNAGQALIAVQENAKALEAIDHASELAEQLGSDPLLLAMMERSAVQVLVLLEEFSPAIRRGERTLDILEALEPSERQQAEVALTYQLLSAAQWSRGTYRQAGRYGERAVLAARAAGFADQPIFAVSAFHTGAYYSYRDRPLDAAYWFKVAEIILNREYTQSNIYNASIAWGNFERDKLNDRERRSLLERLREDSVYQTVQELEKVESDWSVDSDQDFVGAVPVRRNPPRYPSNAVGIGAEGLALIQFDVNEQGRTENIEIIYALPYRDFGEASERAVRQWTYTPATRNGETVRHERLSTLMVFEMGN